LEEHFYQSYAEVLEKQNWRNKIDYEQVSSKLNILREGSMNFLKSNLE